MAKPMYFQWQNEVLLKSIYPMRETKLRDVLEYYAEIDIWTEYKNKNIASEVKAYQDAQKMAAITAFKAYSALRDYFMRPDVRADYLKFKPLDEAELAEITKLHGTFKSYWPKDIRGERNFVTMQIRTWEQHIRLIQEWIKSRRRRHETMDPKHEKYIPEGKELEYKEAVTLPMAEQEMAQLRAFLATYDKIEQRKLEWYKLKQKDPNFNVPEADFLVQAPSNQQPTVKDIVRWKVEAYKESISKKNQYELLDEIYQRFRKQPQRYPLWLQYMVVHFSGMRYASAHGSWADPKDLLIRLRVSTLEKDLKKMDAATIEKLCKEKVASYEGTSKPKLALAPEKQWKDKVSLNLSNMKSAGPQTRRYGLTSMLKDEITYEYRSMTTQQALDTLKSMKATFPAWAWKEIVRLTPLRVTEVTDPGWEKLTQQEESEHYLPQYNDVRVIVDQWKADNTTNWREEHGRSHELIVTRAVCNETAEHIQHLRGHLPPGGLTPKPKWYLTNETENKLPGNPRPYYVKPAEQKHYTPGASILWLRFVDKQPDAWQIAKPVETKDKVGLIPTEYKNRKPANNKDANWIYKQGEVITRSRTLINEKKQKLNQSQWLRWIHEATVAEVAETADGMVVITFETALPDDDPGVSSIGIVRHYLNRIVDIGTEDNYFGSFVGFVPEGQVPVEHLKEMLDWKKILPT